MCKSKECYSISELLALDLSCLPKTDRGLQKKAKKENWLSRPRSGRGGGLEYAFDSLPKAVQLEISARQTAQLMKASQPQAVAVVKTERDLEQLTHKDRLRVDNRLLLCLLVEQYALELGSQDKALDFVSDLSKKSALPVLNGLDYNDVCANAKASRAGGVGIGKRKLHEWVIEHKKASTPTQRLAHLAPAKQGRPSLDVMSMAWLMDFMAVYRNPNGLSVAVAYRIFATGYGEKVGVDNVPSLAQVRSAMNKLPTYFTQRGRMTGSQYKQLLPYIKRDWNAPFIKNNDIWVGDGHSLKLKVKHPVSQGGITPELTVIMDAPSRYIVGFSLSYSENGFAVLDALAMGLKNFGVPAIYYSDNGGGQTNEMLDNAVTGVLPRLGITHLTGLPANPQGRGIIERFMKGVPKLIAQSFESYYGKDGDKETVRKNLYAIASYSKAVVNGKVTGEMTDLQKRGEKITPTWQELYDTVQVAIEWYNHNHRHKSLGGMTPAEKRAELANIHQNEPIWLKEIELNELVLPVVERVASRGMVKVKDDYYFSRLLLDFDGKTVYLHLNQHDLSQVIIKDKDGVYICTAIKNANTVPAFSEQTVSQANVNRVKGAIKRKENQVKQLKAQIAENKVIEVASLDRLIGDDDLVGKPKDSYDRFLGDDEFEPLTIIAS